MASLLVRRPEFLNSGWIRQIVSIEVRFKGIGENLKLVKIDVEIVYPLQRSCPNPEFDK